MVPVPLQVEAAHRCTVVAVRQLAHLPERANEMCVCLSVIGGHLCRCITNLAESGCKVEVAVPTTGTAQLVERL